jgi:hypothetical protein
MFGAVIVFTAATTVVNAMPVTRTAKPAKNSGPNPAGYELTLTLRVGNRKSCVEEIAVYPISIVKSLWYIKSISYSIITGPAP